jgi:hypothetical protein
MASINDIGVPGQPLATPPLTAWQAAVRDKLNNADVWQTYAPTVGGAAYSSLQAWWARSGNVVIVSIKATVSSVSGAISFGTPKPADPANVGAGLGVARMICAGGNYFGMVSLSGTSTLAVDSFGANGVRVVITPTVPATWAAGNTITFVVSYAV